MNQAARREAVPGRITCTGVFVGCLLFAVWTGFAAVLTCPYCGYEYQPGLATCAHCGHALPASTPEEPVPEPADEPTQPEVPREQLPPEVERAIQQAVQDEVKLATAALRAQESARAALHARNALAVRQLLPPQAEPTDTDVRGLLRTAMGDLAVGTEECFVCKGSGQRMQPVVTMTGETRVQSLPDRNCTLCRGVGAIKQHRSASQVSTALAKASHPFREYHQQSGSVRTGDIWIPAAASDHLNVRRTAAMNTVYASICDECFGTGMEGCKKCDGLGFKPCPNKDCVMGLQVCPTCHGTMRERVEVKGKTTVTRSCSTCQRRGVIDCPDCEIGGAILCENCSGRGDVLCRKCGGDGEPARCHKCDGAGYVVCSRCDGSGQYKGAPCPACEAEGVVACKACRGSGHSRR